MLSRFTVESSHPDFEFMKKSTKRGASELGLDFEPGVNVIVGNNGAGKTTFFNALKALLMFGQGKEHCTYDIQEGFSVSEAKPCYFFTMNEMGARNQLRNTDPSDLRKIAYHMECAEMSSGQQMMEVIEGVSYLKEEASMICIDEPEISLDSTNMIKLIKGLNAIAEQGVQVIIVSHHPMLVLNKKFNVMSLNGSDKYVTEMRKHLNAYTK